MRLIDADKLKFVPALIEPVLAGDEPHWETIILKDRIDNAPTVEVAPVAHGKWLWELADNGWADHICSVCGFTENTDIHVYLDWRYCPNCGARMDAKRKEHETD